MARTSITIALELDDTVDVPVGLVRLPDGTERPFHGWLGLSEVIDALIGSDAPGGTASPDAPPGRPHPPLGTRTGSAELGVAAQRRR
jgi:hypothetical protein